MNLLTTTSHELAEGARWVDGRIVFVDILAGRLYELTADGERLLVGLDVPLGAVAPLASGDGWIAAAGTGFALLGHDGSHQWLARPENGSARMNDGVCDPAGRFWAGSMALDQSGESAASAGSLYRLDADGSVTRVLTGLGIVNGPAFTADGTTMYVADSLASHVYRCSVDPGSGSLGELERFVEVAGPGGPDGMTVDSLGRLWVAIWGGSAVCCYDPTGSLLQVVDVPARRPTSPCLADGRLYVTTASDGLDDPGPTEGAVLACEVDASAPPAVPYRRA